MKNILLIFLALAILIVPVWQPRTEQALGGAARLYTCMNWMIFPTRHVLIVYFTSLELISRTFDWVELHDATWVMMAILQHSCGEKIDYAGAIPDLVFARPGPFHFL